MGTPRRIDARAAVECAAATWGVDAGEVGEFTDTPRRIDARNAVELAEAA